MPESSGLGAVVKHVAQMRVTVRAHDLGACHSVAIIRSCFYPTFDRIPKTRPTSAGVEFGFRCVEWRIARAAMVRADFLMIVILAAKRALGALFPQDLEFFV